MKQCEFESRVVQASRAGQTPSELKAHIDGCKSCQETHRLVVVMSGLAVKTEMAVPPMPDAMIVWEKATVRGSSLSRSLLGLVSAAVIVLALVGGSLLYDRIFHQPVKLSKALLQSPFAGTPFPLDGGLLLLLLAIGLILFLPQAHLPRPKKFGGTLVSL